MLTAKIIRKHCERNSNCIDVGSLEGEITRLFLKVAPEGQHYAFEPLPYYYNMIREKYGDRVKVVNKALSDVEGNTVFHFVRSNPPYSGIKKRRYDRAGEEVEQIEVEVAPLDAIIPDSYKADLVKIDVEGAELLVMKGAGKLLKRDHPLIIFEHGKGGADVYGYTPEDVFQFLVDELDYGLYTLSGWYQGKASLSRGQFSACFYEGSEYYFVAGFGS